jgi:nicotinate-nucleotide adenylyltransferase
MAKVAVESDARFSVDARELEREGVSYSVDTLMGLRAEHQDRSLCLLLGMDAFLSLPSWHRWEELIGLAHIVVAHRPGWQAPTDGVLGKLVREHSTEVPQDLSTSRSGRIFITPVTQLEISATSLRKLIRKGFDPKYLVPKGVGTIIAETGCYSEERIGCVND